MIWNLSLRSRYKMSPVALRLLHLWVWGLFFGFRLSPDFCFHCDFSQFWFIGMCRLIPVTITLVLSSLVPLWSGNRRSMILIRLELLRCVWANICSVLNCSIAAWETWLSALTSVWCLLKRTLGLSHYSGPRRILCRMVLPTMRSRLLKFHAVIVGMSTDSTLSEFAPFALCISHFLLSIKICYFLGSWYTELLYTQSLKTWMATCVIPPAISVVSILMIFTLSSHSFRTQVGKAKLSALFIYKLEL